MFTHKNKNNIYIYTYTPAWMSIGLFYTNFNIVILLITNVLFDSMILKYLLLIRISVI